LQNGGGVGDVLRGRAPVAVLAQLVPAVRIDLVDDGDDRVADLLGLGFEFCPIDLVDIAFLTISSAASRGIRPSSPCTLASARSMSRYLAVRFSSDQTWRMAASLNMSPKIFESMIEAGMVFPLGFDGCGGFTRP